jgi:hypothetical protein
MYVILWNQLLIYHINADFMRAEFLKYDGKFSHSCSVFKLFAY